MFPVFPVLFPARSQSCRNGLFKFPVFRISCVLPIDAVPYANHIIREHGTLGTIGTGLKRLEF
jgi:hypothetical protein